jgi:hypothetical protein
MLIAKSEPETAVTPPFADIRKPEGIVAPAAAAALVCTPATVYMNDNRSYAAAVA